ncbi:uncharacterized protein [Temnothorax longispinosus]|uniref:uncharacterized protein n=1 Tax=Temnothorax longispinosus TaxID=300112 RepID=UPI003A99F854
MCLMHLAEQHKLKYLIGSAHIIRDFYIDDLLTGADTFQEAMAIRDESIQLLSLGSFELGKWASNCPELLKSVNNQEGNLINIDDGGNSYVLGIQWNQVTDTFHFSYEPDTDHNAVSKRTILSEVSKLFDPLGLLGPTIVIAKLILQDLWRSGAQRSFSFI